jgi:hypothetical protein
MLTGNTEIDNIPCEMSVSIVSQEHAHPLTKLLGPLSDWLPLFLKRQIEEILDDRFPFRPRR